jgi:hypothetical protein
VKTLAESACAMFDTFRQRIPKSFKIEAVPKLQFLEQAQSIDIFFLIVYILKYRIGLFKNLSF